MSISIRRAGVSDAQAIWLVHQESVRRLCRAEYTAHEINSWVRGRYPAHFRWAMTEAGEIMFVAEVADRIVGFSSLRSGEVQAVYVAPGWERRGVGRKLYRAVEDYARSQNLKRLKLHATLTAVAFYRALGYIDVRETCFQLIDGTRLLCVRMEKVLAGG